MRPLQFSIAPMQDSDIPEVLQTIASAFPAELKGLGLSEAAFVELHQKLLATERGRRAFGFAGVAREEKKRETGDHSDEGRGAERGAFLGVVVVQGTGGGEDEEEEEEEEEEEQEQEDRPPLLLLARLLRSLRAADFARVRSLCGARVAALHLARDLLLPEALGDRELLLEYLVVAPAARGKGVGRALLEFAVAAAEGWGGRRREGGVGVVGVGGGGGGGGDEGGRPSEQTKRKSSLTLWVDEENAAALSLYSSAGFRRVSAGCCGSGGGGGSGEKDEEEEEEGESGEGGSRGVSLSSVSYFAAAAMTLYHRALCRFFLGSSRWVRLALPLGDGEK